MAVASPASLTRLYARVTDALNGVSWTSYSTGAISSTVSTTTLTVTGGSFTSADVGKKIQIVGAGASGATLSTTITGYTSATVVTVGNAAGTTVTNAAVTYGGILDDDRRGIQPIEYAIIDADAEVCRALCANIDHPEAYGFITTSSDLTHGTSVPECIAFGPVEIKVTSGSYKPAKGWATVSEIEGYRTNSGSIYTSAAHDAAASLTWGYYNIRNRRIYFSGLNARVYYTTFTPTYTACQAPDIYEGLIKSLAIRRLIKSGDAPDIYRLNTELGEQGLKQIETESGMKAA